MGLNYDNPDYDNYVLRYKYAEYPSELNIFNLLDVGFTIIQSYSKESYGIDYPIFRLILSICLFILLGLIIYNKCKYYNLLFSYYLLFYLALDEIQIRNFTSFVILLPFLLYFIKNLTWNSLIIYVYGVSLAFTFHFSAVFYLIFCLIYFKSNKLKTIFTICILFLMISIKYVSSDLAMLSRTEEYNAPSLLGVLANSALLVINYLFIKYSTTHFEYKKNIYITKYHSYQICDSNIIIQLNMILLILIPLIFMNAVIIRIFRFLSFVNLLYLFNELYLNSIVKRKIFLLIYITLYVMFINLFWFNEPEVFPSILKNNIFE